MARKDYMDRTITWQAHSVAWINHECLKEGKFPNGQKLTAKDIAHCNEEIKTSNEILKHYGCEEYKPAPKPQLELF